MTYFFLKEKVGKKNFAASRKKKQAKKELCGFSKEKAGKKNYTITRSSGTYVLF